METNIELIEGDLRWFYPKYEKVKTGKGQRPSGKLKGNEEK